MTTSAGARTLASGRSSMCCVASWWRSWPADCSSCASPEWCRGRLPSAGSLTSCEVQPAARRVVGYAAIVECGLRRSLAGRPPCTSSGRTTVAAAVVPVVPFLPRPLVRYTRSRLRHCACVLSALIRSGSRYGRWGGASVASSVDAWWEASAQRRFRPYALDSRLAPRHLRSERYLEGGRVHSRAGWDAGEAATESVAGRTVDPRADGFHQT